MFKALKGNSSRESLSHCNGLWPQKICPCPSPRTYDYDLIWKKDLSICNEVNDLKMISGWDLNLVAGVLIRTKEKAM